MPSWNIHIAHAEELLAREGGLASAVRDRNAFLFGNVIPDIRVGYMVPGIVDPIPYRITHFAKPEHIPKPREWEFWDTYVVPAFEGAGLSGVGAVEAAEAAVESVTPAAPVLAPEASAEDARPERDDGEQTSAASAGCEAREGAASSNSDGAASTTCGRAAGSAVPLYTLQQDVERLNRVHYPQRYEGTAPLIDPAAGEPPCSEADVAESLRGMLVGTWLHLLADNIWNAHVNEFLDSIGGKPSEGFRIKKQGDFDWFGKTLAIGSIVRVTDRLARAAARFPQYAITRDEVLLTAGVVHEVVRENPGRPDHEPYRLLTDEFFSSTFAEVADTAERLFSERWSA